MLSAEDEWSRAAEGLGLDVIGGDLLPQESKALLAEQMHRFMACETIARPWSRGWLLVYDDPWNCDHTLDFALCLQHLGEFEAACRFYSTALLLDATDAYCLYRLGECLDSLGDQQEAQSAFQAAIDSSRDDAAYAEVGQQAKNRLKILRGSGEVSC